MEPKGAKPRGFDTYSECCDQVLDGTVDAMTTDGSILLGYAAQNPDELKVVGEPFSEERYGVGYPKEYPEMCEWINDTLRRPTTTALGRGVRDHARQVRRRDPRAAGAGPLPGSLTSDLVAGLHPAAAPTAPSGREPDSARREERAAVDAVFVNFDLVLKAFGLTVLLFLLSGVVSLLLGTLLAACGSAGRGARARPRRVYVTLVRNTPLLMVFIFVFIAMPVIGINFNFVEGVEIAGCDVSAFFFTPLSSALTLYTSAFVCEAIRSGINAVPLGQAEAAARSA